MGSFTYKCLAVEDLKHPIRSRCKGKVGEVGVLCEKCKEKAQTKTIHVLMHREVTENYGIKFNNQLTVPIFLGNPSDKPESKFQDDEKRRNMKKALFDELREINLDEIKDMWKELKLGKFNPEKYDGEYKIHYYSCMKIIDKFISMSK